MNRLKRVALRGFILGATVPLFWGIVGFLLFNVPESWFSRLFWNAVYVTCPFWVIDENAMILMPLLNGSMYAIIAVLVAKARQAASKAG